GKSNSAVGTRGPPQCAAALLLPVSFLSSHVMAHHAPRILQAFAKIQRDRALKARVELAIPAAKILLGAVKLPIGRFMQFCEGWIVAVGYEVAGSFPSLWVTRHRRPWAAQEIAFANQVVKVNWRVDNFVIMRQIAHTSELQRHLLVFEIYIVFEYLVVLPGCQQHTSDAQPAKEFDQLLDLLRAGFPVNRGVGLHAVALTFKQFDHPYARIEDAFAVYHAVVCFAHTVKMNVEAQVGTWRNA